MHYSIFLFAVRQCAIRLSESVCTSSPSNAIHHIYFLQFHFNQQCNEFFIFLGNVFRLDYSFLSTKKNYAHLFLLFFLFPIFLLRHQFCGRRKQIFHRKLLSAMALNIHLSLEIRLKQHFLSLSRFVRALESNNTFCSSER